MTRNYRQFWGALLIFGVMSLVDVAGAQENPVEGGAPPAPPTTTHKGGAARPGGPPPAVWVGAAAGATPRPTKKNPNPAGPRPRPPPPHRLGFPGLRRRRPGSSLQK
jgi:hypothetical protein